MVQLITRLPVIASLLLSQAKFDSRILTSLYHSSIRRYTLSCLQQVAGLIITAVPSHTAHTLPRSIFNLNYFRRLLNGLLATKILFLVSVALFLPYLPPRVLPQKPKVNRPYGTEFLFENLS